MASHANLEGNTDVSDDYGCEHYKRNCSFFSPCCNKFYTCRLCHDDKENHELNRNLVSQIRCNECQTTQKVGATCEKCSITFGKYFCSICRLYDDRDKKQFHCQKCGICRVGGQENFFHCDKCGLCLALVMKDSHKCIENVSHSNCPICMEDLHTSRISSHVPPCGHLVHKTCFDEMLRTGNFACALCGESMVPMSESWKMLDEEIKATPMPEEYRDKKVQILCKDCHKECRTNFHIFGLKCQNCGSYNTCRAAEREFDEQTLDGAAEDVLDAGQVNAGEDDAGEDDAGAKDETDDQD